MRHLPAILLGIFTVFAAFLILAYPQPIVLDQAFIKYVFSLAGYPRFDNGVTSLLLVGLYNKLFSPSLASVDAQVRLFAMCFYVFAAFWLATRVIRGPALLAAFVAFLFVSRMPFLWLSSELFAGAFLCLCSLALIENWPPRRTGALLALAAFTKPDVLLVAAALLAYRLWVPRFRRDRIAVAGTFAAVLLALNLPGFAAHGAAYGNTRALSAFGQHYADLVHPHQLMANAPDPWGTWESYLAAVFPGAHTPAEIVRLYPSKYLDFVALSVVKGLKNLIRTFGLLLLFVPLRLAYRGETKPFEKIVAVTLIGFVPMVLLAFPHVRYMARYYPLVVLVVLGFVERFRGPARQGAALALTIALGAQLVLFVRGLAGVGGNALFWFPD